jgi:hypothetical protein
MHQARSGPVEGFLFCIQSGSPPSSAICYKKFSYSSERPQRSVRYFSGPDIVSLEEDVQNFLRNSLHLKPCLVNGLQKI